MTNTEQNKTIILWIHGFAGKANNDTVKAMRKYCPDYEIHSIEVDHHAIASMKKIDAFIDEHPELTLVAGTSLGGFYAMCANTQLPKLVVNPVTNPARDLHQFLGMNTYKPGREDGQTDFEFTEEMLHEFSEIKIQSLYNVLCQHTAHDHVLGEDIKKEYHKMFFHIQEIDEKTLPNHFLTFNYAKKGLGKAVEYLNNISGWIAEHMIPVIHTVEETYAYRKEQLPQRPADYHNAEEIELIEEIAKMEDEMVEYDWWSKEWSNLLDEVYALYNNIYHIWMKVGIPELIFEENGKVGLKDYAGNIVLPAEYDDIRLNYDKVELLHLCYTVACKNGKWGIVSKAGETILPFEYEEIYPRESCDYGVKKHGKWGVYSVMPEKWTLECSHDMVYSNAPSPMQLVVYSDNGKFGWVGCQDQRYDAEAEYDAVYLPTPEYDSSPEYSDDYELFEAQKDGCFYTIEYWTCK